MTDEVPSSIDYLRMEEAKQWSDTTTPRRPWRLEFFAAFTAAVEKGSKGKAVRVLELGSGPGVLAKTLLQALPNIEYVGLDFSPAMHELARKALGPMASRATLIERSLKDKDWTENLGRYDFVVTNQVVHELRHKRHARGLHSQVKEVLVASGSYLVCDHFLGDGGMSNDQLYMSAEEQRQTLLLAGFARVEMLMKKGDLVLHHAI